MPKLNPQVHTFTDRDEPDDTPGDYYVSCVDGGRFAFLAGPFHNDHEAALWMVPRARKLACALDPKAVFYGFGTCRREPDPTRPAPPGRLNVALGLGDQSTDSESSGQCELAGLECQTTTDNGNGRNNLNHTKRR